MADELNTPTHRWYEPRNNISLPKTDFSAQTIYASGIQKIDAWINSQPWGNPVPGLFALAEPGAWYDPSDLTTLFQDAAGTTPVTAAGQPVGLVLDKSGRGNHATQTTAASRPTYGVVPATGRRNLLTWTTFGGAAAGTPGSAPTDWPFNSSGGSITSASGGVIGFSAIAARQIIGQAVTVSASQTQTWSVRVVSNPNGLQFFQLFAVINSTGLSTLEYFANGTLVVNTVYVPQAGDVLSARLVNGGTQIAPTFRIGVGASGVATGSASFTEPQAEIGSTATAYQRVTTAFDVTEAGVQSLSYLSFDGIDDFLVTPTITPNIDKVQVFAGVRKLSDATTGLLVELSASADSNAGGFYLANLSSGAWQPQTGPIGARTYTPYLLGSAPRTSVLATVLDNAAIGAGEISLRENGQIRTGTAVVDGGGASGNYLAYPMYIGRRGGTTLPFNGYLYGLVVRFGANLDANTITATENWLNTKTGAY